MPTYMHKQDGGVGLSKSSTASSDDAEAVIDDTLSLFLKFVLSV